MEMISYMQNPDHYKELGVRLPKGIILHGPPGTGKTLIAKAASSELKVPVLWASGSEFVELYVGMGAKRVRELFAHARKIIRDQKKAASKVGCLIFIDEIDAVAFARRSSRNPGMGMATQSSREAETTLNQLLSEMDGFEDSEGIIVMAATNLVQNIDPAILRPGRFDHKIEITLPNTDERMEIL